MDNETISRPVNAHKIMCVHLRCCMAGTMLMLLYARILKAGRSLTQRRKASCPCSRKVGLGRKLKLHISLRAKHLISIPSVLLRPAFPQHNSLCTLFRCVQRIPTALLDRTQCLTVYRDSAVSSTNHYGRAGRCLQGRFESTLNQSYFADKISQDRQFLAVIGDEE